MIHSVSRLLALITLIAPAPVALAETTAVNLQYVQPLSCKVDLKSTQRTSVVTRLILQEYCNDGRGYRLIVDHADNLATVFEIDGRAVPADPDGSTVLKHVGRAQIVQSELVLRDGATTLSLRIEPASLLP